MLLNNINFTDLQTNLCLGITAGYNSGIYSILAIMSKVVRVFQSKAVDVCKKSTNKIGEQQKSLLFVILDGCFVKLRTILNLSACNK